MRQVIQPPERIDEIAVPPGDKSISIRALLLNGIAVGKAHTSNLCVGDDRTSILRCLRGLGIRILKHPFCEVHKVMECFEIRGQGPEGLSEPTTVLNAGNSATTMRLVSGLLAAQPFFSVITGDRSLRQRPMDRIVHPLTAMGATIIGRSQDSMAPLAIRGGDIHGIDYPTPVASAQVKSSILIAGLHAWGETTIHEPLPSRDHTERMMREMGADLTVDQLSIVVRRSQLSAMDVRVPGDMSSAAFWLIAGCCHPNARITVKGISINPSRTGILDVLKTMGAQLKIENVQETGGEPSADLIVESSDLKATEISGDIIPRVIDELPLLALAACFAKGTTIIRDARELRFKESDRIQATVAGLSRLGARIEGNLDGMVVHGVGGLTGASCNSFGDHRIAMVMGIAGLLASGETTVSGAEAANVSYPNFWTTLKEFQQPRK